MSLRVELSSKSSSLYRWLEPTHRCSFLRSHWSLAPGSSHENTDGISHEFSCLSLWRNFDFFMSSLERSGISVQARPCKCPGCVQCCTSCDYPGQNKRDSRYYTNNHLNMLESVKMAPKKPHTWFTLAKPLLSLHHSYDTWLLRVNIFFFFGDFLFIQQ